MSALQSLVVLDGRVNNEKLAELLDLQGEHPELDYKRIIDLGSPRGKVEIVKDMGAMCPRGGYLIGGVDQHGTPTGEMDGCDERPFDDASLTQTLRRYLPDSVTVSSRVVEHQGHKVVIIYVPPHPDGYAVFRADGKYQSDQGVDVYVFRAGEIFWRDGTRSTRITQEGIERIISARVEAAKAEWMDEQQEIRRRERAEIAAGYEARAIADAPLGTLNLSLTSDELRGAALELVRKGDRLGIKHLLSDGVRRARTALVEGGDVAALDELLDKLAGLAAVFLEYEVDEFFTETIGIFASIYSLPLGPRDDEIFSRNININPDELAPRVELAVIERIYALGALAVRLRRWSAIRELTLQRPERVDDYWPNWLRHAGVMAARANHLRQTENGQTREISLLTLVAAVVDNVPELHPDTDDTDAILTSLAQFDFLSNVAAIDGAGELDDRAYYTNWARFRQERIQPVADRVIADPALRAAVFSDRDDAELAAVFRALGQMAGREAFRYDGFWGWDRGPVGDFLAAHPPEPADAAS